MALTIDCRMIEGEGCWEIKLAGEVDIASAAKFRAALTESYDSRPADVRLDASELCYIDSTGLGVIIGAYGRMQANSHSIRIENPRANVEKLLHITSLDKIFCS
ncbi:MAG: STAS domain-containing protein [Clostridiales Family XIII bacterium]|jgi:anti-sigma B factor antagonist|nr:STAS domain-containing protein [Clostridiales Family XIII bacterium]